MSDESIEKAPQSAADVEHLLGHESAPDHEARMRRKYRDAPGRTETANIQTDADELKQILTNRAERTDPERKDTNPKDAVGVRKAPLSTVPAGVMLEVGLAMLEGARKYGRHNYRAIGVRASVYYDAAMRHLIAWWEGEDIDPDSGLSHITKALACLAVLRDAQHQSKCEDDRPPKSPPGWMQVFNACAGDIVERYPDPKEPYTEK